MSNEDIIRHFRNPFVGENAGGYARFLGNALWGACVVVCIPLVPLALLGWAIATAADWLEKAERRRTDEA